MIPVRDPAGLPLMLRGLPPVDEVIVVAEPGTADAAVLRRCRPDALLVHPTRPGLGNALACGFAAGSGDVVVTLNGDGSTDPGEIPRYVNALVRGADVVLGSRYRDGGRDLTGGRFRRWADLLLIWCVNVLFGTRRTDPGFGYTAFWRDSIGRLDLPDPSARAAAAWGDGPEIGPLLALRPAARGLVVAEVGSVAYPRMRRAARADRAGLWHWLRVMAAERSARPRHAAAHRTPVAAGAALSSPFAPGRTALTPPGQPPAAAVRAPATSGLSRGGGPDWIKADRRPTGEPIWGPPSRRAVPEPDLWPAPHRQPGLGTPWSGENTRPAWPRNADAQPPAGGAHREIGSRRRRIEGFRQPRPDLRVINGEGTGATLGRNGRLRSVPRNKPGH